MAPDLSERAAEARSARASSKEAMRAKIRAMREAKQEAQAASPSTSSSSARGSIVAAADAAVGSASSSQDSLTPDSTYKRSQLGVAQLGVPQRLGASDRLSQIDPRHLSWYAEEDEGEDESTLHGHNRAEAAAAAAEEAAEAAAVAALASARATPPSGARTAAASPSAPARPSSPSHSPEPGRQSTETGYSYSSGSTGGNAFGDSSRPATSMSSGSSRPNTSLSIRSRRASGKLSRKKAADVLEGLEAELRAQRAGSPQLPRSGPPSMALPELPAALPDAKRSSSSASASASGSASSLGRFEMSMNTSEVSLAASQSSSSAGSAGRAGWSTSPIGGPPAEPLPTLPNSPSSASAAGSFASTSRRASAASRGNVRTSSSLRSTPSPAPSSGAMSNASVNRASCSSAYSSGSSARGGASAATPATTADDMSRKARHSGAGSVSSFAPSDASIVEENTAHPHGSGGSDSSEEALSDVLHLPVTQASMSFFQAMMPTVAPGVRALAPHKGGKDGPLSVDDEERRRRSLLHKSIGGLAAALGEEADQWASMPNSPMSYVPSDYRPSFDSMRESIDEGHSSHTAHGAPVASTTSTAPLASASSDRANLTPSPSMTDDRRGSTATRIVQLYADSTHDGESPSRGNTPQPTDAERGDLPPRIPPKDFGKAQHMTPSSSSSSVTAPTISVRDSSLSAAERQAASHHHATPSASSFAPMHATTPSISISIDEAASGSEDSDDLSSGDDGPRKRRKQKGRKGRKGWGFEEQRAAPSRVTPGSTAFPTGVVPSEASQAATGGNDPWAFYQFSPDLPPFVGPGVRPMDLTGRGTWRAIATRGLGAGLNPGMVSGLNSGLNSARSSTLTLGHQSEAGSTASTTAGPVSMRQVAAQARANLERANSVRERQHTLLAQRSFQPVDIHEHASSHQSVILDPSSHSIFSFDSSVRVGDHDVTSMYAGSDFGTMNTISRSVSMAGSMRSSRVTSEAGTDMRAEPAPAKQYAVMATQTSPSPSPEVTPTHSPRLRSTAVGTGADDEDTEDTVDELEGLGSNLSPKQRRRETAQLPNGLARPLMVWSDDEDAAAGGEARAPTPSARNGGKTLVGRKSMPLTKQHRRTASASSTDLDDPTLWAQSLRAPRLTSRKSIAGFRAYQKASRASRLSASGNQSESTVGLASEFESAMESDGDDGSDDDDASSSGASDESDLDISTPLELLAERSGALDPTRQSIARGEKRKLRQKGTTGTDATMISGPRKIAPAPRSRLNGIAPSARAAASAKAGWSSPEDRAATPQRYSSSKASPAAKSPTPTPTNSKGSLLAAPTSAGAASASFRVGLGIRKSQSMNILASRRATADSSDDEADLLSLADAHDESLLDSSLDLPSIDDDDFMPSSRTTKPPSQVSSTQKRGSLKFPTPPRRISPPMAARSSAGSSAARSSGGASIVVAAPHDRPMSVELQPSPDAGHSDKFDDTPSTQAGSELWTSIGDRASIATTVSEASSDGALSGEAASSLAHAESLEASTGHSSGHSRIPGAAAARDSLKDPIAEEPSTEDAEADVKPVSSGASSAPATPGSAQDNKEIKAEASDGQATETEPSVASPPSEAATSPRSSVTSPVPLARSAIPTPRKAISALPQPRTPMRPRLSKANLSESASNEKSTVPTPRQSTLPRATTPLSSAGAVAAATPSRLPAPGGLRRMKSSGDLPRPSLVVPGASTMPTLGSGANSPGLHKSPSPISASPSPTSASATGSKAPSSVLRSSIPRSASSLNMASVAGNGATSGIPRSSLGGSGLPRRSPSIAAIGAAAGANKTVRANAQ